MNMLFGLATLFGTSLTLLAGGATGGASNRLDAIVNGLRWHGQAGVSLRSGGKTVYIDPFMLDREVKLDKADVVLITHGHADHLSPDDLKLICTDATILIAPDNCHDQLKDIPRARLLALAPGQSASVAGLGVTAVPAYNVVKTKFHPKANRWVGYVLDCDGVRIYHAGDTERIPEMQAISCDIALLPLGQTYTMNSVEEAAQAALDVKAAVAIPIHYGKYEGTDADAKKFQALLKGKLVVRILPKH